MGVFDKLKTWWKVGEDRDIKETGEAPAEAPIILKPIEEKKVEALKSIKIKYICDKCHYTFSRKEDFAIRLCPMCGKEAISRFEE